MLKHTISYCEGNSFLEKQLFKLKLNSFIKECDAIKENLKRSGEIRKEDYKFNIVIPTTHGKASDRKYLVTKGYNKDGSLKPIKKYKLDGDKVVEELQKIDTKIIVVDLYEKSMYLHGYEKDMDHVTGYILKEEKDGKGNNSLIFTPEKVRILIKNTNAMHEYENLESFMDKFFM